MAQDSGDWIKQGTEAFRHARYPEAITAFQKASDAEPKNPVPHLYLAFAWFQRYIPGAVSADDADMGRHAEAEFHRALDLEPSNWIALVMLGEFAFDER